MEVQKLRTTIGHRQRTDLPELSSETREKDNKHQSRKNANWKQNSGQAKKIA